MSITRKVTLVGLALILGLLYLWSYQNTDYFSGIVLPHGEVGYNFACYNSVKVNPDRMSFIAQLQKDKNRIVDYAEIDQSQFGKPTQYRNICDTIGYGVLLGLLWKITHSYKYIDVQILQLLMYLLMLFFVYQLVLLLFANSWFAYFACLIHITFLPLLSQNAHIMRDIWAYYATVILLYGVAKAVTNKKYPSIHMLLCGFFFAFCTFLRPTLFFTLFVVLIFVLGWGIYNSQKTLSLKLCFSLLITSILFFWIPFVVYNQTAYNRWFVSPSGMWLVEGIGSFPNQWGYQLSDQWYTEFMKEKYGLNHGTPECEDKGRELYWAAVKENPGFFVKALFKQIPYMIFPELPWCEAMKIPQEYNTPCNSWTEKFQRFCKYPSKEVFFNFFFLKWFKYMFMLFSYIGMVCMMIDRRWFALFLLGTIVLSGYHFIFSHIEPRYVVPFYWPCSIFMSYFFMKMGSINRGKYYWRAK